jgi:hypothetical protein
MSEELGWDAKRRKKEWIDTRKWLVSMGLEELGALEEDRKFMNESESRWSWDPLNWIQDKGSTARPVPVAHISHSRAHFSLDELEALKDIFAERTSAFAALQSAPVDDTLTLQRHGLPADIVLEVIRDDLGYVDASKLDGTGTKNVHKALMKVGVKDANKQGRLISFDEFVDVSAFRDDLNCFLKFRLKIISFVRCLSCRWLHFSRNRRQNLGEILCKTAIQLDELSSPWRTVAEGFKLV